MSTLDSDAPPQQVIPTPESEEARLEPILLAGGVSDATRTAALEQFKAQSAQNPPAQNQPVAAPVAAVRARPTEEIPRLDTRQGSDGRVRPLDSSEGRLRAAEVIRENPGASLREIAASAGVSPETARSVRARLRAGDDPARNQPQPPGRTAGASAPGSRDRELAAEINSILQKLSRDPSLRHSETGRTLLQLICAKSVDGTVQATLIQESPSHSRPLLASLARYNASIWKGIADEILRQSPT